MKKLLYLSMLLVGLIGNKVSAQVTISAEVRPRTEFRNGFKTLREKSYDPVLFTEQRSRIYMDYASENFRMMVSFQDIRIWGESPQIFKTELGKTFINEAWGQYYFNPEFSLKVGRQMISYDNERILGGLEWAQQGRRHDAVLFIYEKAESRTKLHVGAAYNQDSDVPEPRFYQAPGASFYNVAGNYKTFQYAWYNKLMDNGSLSLIAMNVGIQNADSTVSFKQTWGAHGFQNIAGVKFGGDFFYQTGKQGSRDVRAMLAGINATVITKLTPLTLGVEYISGDKDPTDSRITAFSPDFGTNHAHNGFMDYFFVGPENASVGVTDFYLKSSFPLAGGVLNLNIHEFLTGSSQFDQEGVKLNRTMGTEVDLVFVKQLKGGVTWHLGYSQMFATETMMALRGGDKSLIHNWAWTMITFKPTLFSTK
ncbi:alginate export family protein [Arthrospiribacter ruber]|uniref:Alginate export domain-containing protein n=1 Tax=Arthrospiribacter ruber TaxID=2487934 RepID=A0A951MD56_9BACT|nr:alginate export family protein [Arthrospiribacter ruber]MBW3466941.1 hypothetical protein [Arthrospiribacter ruber]